jgi:hypothetical protein
MLDIEQSTLPKNADLGEKKLLKILGVRGLRTDVGGGDTYVQTVTVSYAPSVHPKTRNSCLLKNNHLNCNTSSECRSSSASAAKIATTHKCGAQLCKLASAATGYNIGSYLSSFPAPSRANLSQVKHGKYHQITQARSSR